MIRSRNIDTAKYIVVLYDPSSQATDGMFGANERKLLEKMLISAGISPEEVGYLCVKRVNQSFIKTVKFSEEVKSLVDNELSKYSNDTRVIFMGSRICGAMFGKSIWNSRNLVFKYNDKYAVITYGIGHMQSTPEVGVDIWEDFIKIRTIQSLDYGVESLSDYKLVTNENVLGVLAYLSNKSKVGFDIETTGLDPRRGEELRCIGVGTEEDCYIISNAIFQRQDVKDALVALSKKTKVISHFSNFEYKWMLYLGCPLYISSDTILKHHEIDERRTNRKLKFLGTRYFNIPNWSDILQFDDKELGFDNVPDELLYPYLAHDVKITVMLDNFFDKHPEAPPAELYDLIMRARRVLSLMTDYGIPVDKNYLKDLYITMEFDTIDNIRYIEEVLEKEDFNPRSSQMVARILFEELGYPKIDGDSTSKKVIHQLRHMYPEEVIIEKIASTRQILAAQSTFVAGMHDAVHKDGRIRGEFFQHTTATGRLSSGEPNLQNIPRRGELGKLIRGAITIPEGYDWVVEADYSQIEVFIAAIQSGDRAMQKLLAEGGDIYRASAAQFFGKAQEDVTDEEREYFKPIILGSLYLRGPAAIAQQNFTSVEEETEKQKLFFSMFPDYYEHAYGRWSGNKYGKGELIKPGALERAKMQRYIKSRFGRKRRFYYIFADKEHEVRREALNSDIQATASDINLSALVRMYETAEEQDLLSRFRPWNIIHDAILVWITDDFKSECKKFMSEIMLNPPVDLPIPLRVDFKIGKSWGELKKWD